MKQIKTFKLFGKGLVSILLFSLTFASCDKKFTVKGVSGKEYESYQEACYDGDFEAAHNFLHHYYAEYENLVRKLDYDNTEKVSSNAIAYCTAANNVYSSELRYLESIDEPNVLERGIFLIKEMPVIGMKYSHGQALDYEEECLATCYQHYANTKNDICNQLLDMAIRFKNKEIALKTLDLYIENSNFEKYVKDDFFSTEGRKVLYSNEDMDLAKKNLEEAIKNGKFNTNTESER